MKVVDIKILDNRMTEITVARRFLIFLWKYTIYRSISVKIPQEEWVWFNLTKKKLVNEPVECWELNEWTTGERI